METIERFGWLLLQDCGAEGDLWLSSETAGVYTVGFRYSQNYKEDLPVYADLCVDGEVLFSEMNSTVVITAHMMQAIYDSADSHREIML